MATIVTWNFDFSFSKNINRATGPVLMFRSIIKSCFKPSPAITTIRSYRAHVIDNSEHSLGRSVVVQGINANRAYNNLNRTLKNCRLLEIVRYQQTFEKPSDKRRRKRKESQFKGFMRVMKKQVDLAHDLRKRYVN